MVTGELNQETQENSVGNLKIFRRVREFPVRDRVIMTPMAKPANLKPFFAGVQILNVSKVLQPCGRFLVPNQVMTRNHKGGIPPNEVSTRSGQASENLTPWMLVIISMCNGGSPI